MRRSYLLIFILPLLFGCSGSSDNTQSQKPAQQHQGSTGHPAEVLGQQQSGQKETTQVPSGHPAEIMNHPPELVSAKLVTDPDGSLRIDAEAKDQDGDTVKLEYQWTINGQKVSENQSFTGFKKGDTITATVTPFDGKQEGTPQSFLKVFGNTPPVISPSQPVFNYPAWSLQIQAKDADGDPLQYSLVSAPSGMTVDAKTGLVKWNTSGVAAGKYEATAHVSDGKGGEADYSFEVTLGEEEQGAAQEQTQE